MKNEMTLYYDPRGMTSQMARIMLAESGAPCRLMTVRGGFSGDHLAPEFARLNPSMSLPVLACGGERMTTIADIGRALASGAREPVDADTQWLLQPGDYCNLLLEAGLVAGWRRIGLRIAHKRQIRLAQNRAGRHHDLAAAYNAKTSELRDQLNAIGNHEETQARLRHLDVLFNTFEKYIAGREYILGGGWSYVDAIWTAFVARLRRLGLDDFVNRTRHPHTSAYYHRIRRRPSFCQAGLKDGRVPARAQSSTDTGNITVMPTPNSGFNSSPKTQRSAP